MAKYEASERPNWQGLKNFPYSQVGMRHLVGILGQMTDTDWQPFFERYVYGTETPKLS